MPDILKREWLPVLFIAAIVLFGYSGLFAGADFFVDDDAVLLHGYSHGNAIGNGWRPDKGFGISFFFGDPGMAHAWSVFSIWEKIIKLPALAYNSSVILLLILAAISQYVLLKRVAPGMRWISAFLAPLIVFGPLQHEFFFQRHWITLSIGTPLLLMLIYDYFKDPKTVYLLRAGFLLWFVWFFGSFAPFLELLIVSGIFAVTFWIYFKKERAGLVIRAVLLYLTAITMTVLLGFWIFYSVFIEKNLSGYLREPVYNAAGVFSPASAMYFLINLFHCGWLPGNIILPGMDWLPKVSWDMCSVVFPLVLIVFLFKRSSGFWEFSMKWLIVVLFAHEFFMGAVPAYANLSQFIINGYPLCKFQPAYHCFQIGLLGIFISGISAGNFNMKSLLGKSLRSAVAAILCLFYAALFVFAVISVVSPGILLDGLAGLIRVLPFGNLSRAADGLVSYVALFNLKSVQQGMGLCSILFYLSSALLIWIFASKKYMNKISATYKNGLALLLLANALLLSWAIYPLHKGPMVWAQNEIAEFVKSLKPTDRFYSALDKTSQKTKKTLESFKKNWVEEDGAPRRYMPGYWDAPKLSISSGKSFSQKPVADFTIRIFNGDGQTRLGSLRELDAGPFITSKMMNDSAISYYYSFRELPPADGLSLAAKARQLYIYKNTAARPYFYLENRAGVSDGSGVSLKEFSFGRMVFDYYGETANMLIVADAWHPFWKARSGEAFYPVFKCNDIFKEVLLPKGKHEVTLFFDTGAFMPGIYVSIVSWVLFLTVYCVLSGRKKRKEGWL
ncbi:MAG: hypothetical protein PHS46_03405 [Candidatus Omnitrophica bacterium]|nr:hypothetical protein [Candidatus Omnitrophota bacterium]